MNGDWEPSGPSLGHGSPWPSRAPWRTPDVSRWSAAQAGEARGCSSGGGIAFGSRPFQDPHAGFPHRSLDAEPPWTWTASWEKREAEWSRLDDRTLWSHYWQRMAADHGFISPADVRRDQGPDGRTLIMATWISSAIPVTERTMPQSGETYAAWYKGHRPWQTSGLARTASSHSAGLIDAYLPW